MRVVYSDRYHVDIGPHVFPTTKYRLIHDRLQAEATVPSDAFLEPEMAAWRDLELVHTSEYLRKLRYGKLSLTEAARLEIPWSASITDGFRLMAGGTVSAARAALSDGAAVHIGGGFHHAFPGHGEGFCMFNDVALAVRVAHRDAGVGRVAIVDCDVHHGNGTAAIFARDPSVSTFSMHQADNYPTEKPPSSLDVALADGTADDEYLRALDRSLPTVLAHRPDLLFYLAGADPYERDQLGGLALTKAGLSARDRLVLKAARQAGVSVVVVLAGGYAVDVGDTVDIHVATIETAVATFAARGSPDVIRSA